MDFFCLRNFLAKIFVFLSLLFDLLSLVAFKFPGLFDTSVRCVGLDQRQEKQPNEGAECGGQEGKCPYSGRHFILHRSRALYLFKYPPSQYYELSVLCIWRHTEVKELSQLSSVNKGSNPRLWRMRTGHAQKARQTVVNLSHCSPQC